MIDYYFERNDEIVASSFAEAGISLSNKAFKSFVDTLIDRLRDEHNMPFIDFIDLVSCQDIEEAFESGESAIDFADEAIAQKVNATQAYVISLMRKHT